MEEIRKLRDSLEPFSYAIGGIQIKFPFGTDSLCLTAYPSTDEKRRSMEAVLAPYKEKFLTIDLLLHPEPALCWKYLQRIDFLRFKHALMGLLVAEIEALSKRSDPEPIYAFVLGIAPEYHNITLFWNTPSRWAATEAEYRARGYHVQSGGFPSTKYNGPDFRSEALVRDESVWQPVYECLTEHEGICRDFFELTSGGGNFFWLYERRFVAMAVHALQAVAPKLKKVAVTPNFIYFVQGGGDDLFTALETVPEDKLRALFPNAFAGNERG